MTYRLEVRTGNWTHWQHRGPTRKTLKAIRADARALATRYGRMCVRIITRL